MRVRTLPCAAIGMALAVGACEPVGEAIDAVETEVDVVGLGEAANDLSYRGENLVVEAQTGEAGVFASPCVITESSIAGIEAGETLGGFAGAFPAGTNLVFEPMWMWISGRSA